MKKGFLWLAMAAVAMTSCQDEFIKNDNKTMDRIGYAVTTCNISSPVQVRSGEQAGTTTDVYIEEMKHTLGGKQLYLHTVTDMEIPEGIKTPVDAKDGKTPQSRAAEKNETNVDKIGVTGIVWNGDTWAGDNAKKLYMDNVVAESSQGFLTNYYWPAAEDHIRFFAYHPVLTDDADDINNGVKIITSDDTETGGNGVKGAQKLAWTVPGDVTKQHDLLVASSEEPGNKKAEAPLNFGHALTAVQFKLAADVKNVTVTAVRIKGVYYKGTYTYSYCGHNGDDGDATTADTDAGEWDVTEEVYAGTDGNGFEISGLSVTSGIINDGANTFMMMPQALPEGATIEVDIVDNSTSTGTAETLTADIDGRVWKKGTKVVYTITFSNASYILKVVDTSGNEYEVYDLTGTPFNAYGDIGEYYIRSYKVKIGGDVEAVPWRVYSFKGADSVTGTKGEGVASVDDKDGIEVVGDDGTVTLKPYQFGVLPGELSGSDSHTDLSNNGSVNSVLGGNIGTSADPLDLSTHKPDDLSTIARHTANCYIVRRSGYYKLPLVYGNAIKDGVTNTNAFTLTGTGTGVDDEGNILVSREAVRYKMTNASGTTPVMEEETGVKGNITVKALKYFRDHANGENNAEGNPIVGPWIADQESASTNNGTDYTPVTAEIVWQDAPCLITDVKVKQLPDGGVNRYFITFQVHEDVICAGNAVIAVKNEAGHIMWSWHIWVTNAGKGQNPKTITNRRVLGNYTSNEQDPSQWQVSENAFAMAQFQLGYCPAEDRLYTGRTGIIEFVQTDKDGNDLLNDVKASIKFKVENYSLKNNANVPVYQWGRKDPMLPANGDTDANSSANNKTWFDNDRNEHKGEAKKVNQYSGGKSISLTIQNPAIFCNSNGVIASGDANVAYQNWCNTNYINLWNANCTALPMFSYHKGVLPPEYHHNFDDIVAIPVVKTVYDPCPPGWEMPRIDTFTGVVYDGTKAKPYYYYTAEGGVEYTNYANLLHHSYYNGVYQIAFYVNPMPKFMNRNNYEKEIHGTDETTWTDAYWTQGLGLRNSSGNWINYGVYGGMLTSGVACIQWIADDGNSVNDNPIPFKLHSLRFAYIRETNETDANLYDGGYGVLKPMSGSHLELAFGITPVQTGANPLTTTVKGNLEWSSDGSDIKVTF